tara:strand:+ start:535 stop:804 length:270 start_codon:yes stop_codon:yes gene_type:complete
VRDQSHNQRIYYNREGMIIPDSKKAERIIWELKFEMNNPRNDGWTGSDMKKRLWDIKNAVDEALVDAPTYAGEEPYEDIYLMNRIKGKV